MPSGTVVGPARGRRRDRWQDRPFRRSFALARPTVIMAANTGERRVPNRAQDWLRQAERDLEQAVASRRDGRHEWACFAAHQAAEKAVKALHLSKSQEAWGHVVARLLAELPLKVGGELLDKARVLDAAYVPARYPNSHPEGAPFEHYGDLQSREAIAYAGEILGFVRSQMA